MCASRRPKAVSLAPSFIKCEDIRSVAIERFSRRFGQVSPGTLAMVEEHVRVLLQL
ncbi:MAG TPA: type II toxin-antitoxin system PemK/MazF family toxin [Phycisphaerae bacterium]|nr:type II toxin-antitoxin system PemK/MazF family toxin [Phycisphaerae bacterium]